MKTWTVQTIQWNHIEATIEAETWHEAIEVAKTREDVEWDDVPGPMMGALNWNRARVIDPETGWVVIARNWTDIEEEMNRRE